MNLIKVIFMDTKTAELNYFVKLLTYNSENIHLIFYLNFN